MDRFIKKGRSAGTKRLVAGVELSARDCGRGSGRFERVGCEFRQGRRVGDADQDRHPVRLPGRLRLVLQPGPRRSRSPRSSSSPERRRRIPTTRPTGWSAARSPGIRCRSSGSAAPTTRADLAIKQTRRLMEQLGAQIMIGPLSGDESIAVANYAKAHPQWTFVDGAAGAQDTTLKVQAPNFFRFNGDGAMWNAGLGDFAYRKLGWKNAAVISDDYSFALDFDGRLHRRLLRGRRQHHQAGVPAAEHDRLLVLRPAAADAGHGCERDERRLLGRRRLRRCSRR